MKLKHNIILYTLLYTFQDIQNAQNMYVHSITLIERYCFKTWKIIKLEKFYYKKI